MWFWNNIYVSSMAGNKPLTLIDIEDVIVLTTHLRYGEKQAENGPGCPQCSQVAA